MLAKANRLRSADDFRATMRTGRKVSSSNFVVYLKRDLSNTQARFGFVVAKSVGNAVVRNLAKRRLRALAQTKLSQIPQPTDVVVRALPGMSSVDWNTLETEFEEAFTKAFSRGTEA